MLVSHIGIFTTDINLRVTSWNDWLIHHTGKKEDQVLGLSLQMIIPDLDQRGLLERFQKVITNGNVEILAAVFHHYLIEIPVREPAGRYNRMQQRVTIAPLADQETIHGTLVTIEDVTEQMSSETGGKQPEGELNELGTDNWIKRRDVAESLASAGKTIVSEVLRKIRLEHRNLNILSSAMRVISMSEEDVSDLLIEFLNDPDHELRIYSAQMLGEKNTPAVKEALMRALDDPDANVRYHAIESLGKLRAFHAVDRLAEIAGSGEFFTAYPAIDALRLIGDTRAARLIQHLMNDDILGQPVIEAIGELGEADLVPDIVAHINNNSPFIFYLLIALARIAGRYQETLGDGAFIADISRKEFNAQGIRNIVAYVENSADNRELSAIVTVLGWIDHDDISKALTRFLGNPDIRKQVIDALVSSGPRVTDLLTSQLNSDPEVRQAAVMALGRIGGEKAVDALLPLLKDDDVAVICCSALARIGSGRAFEALMSLLGHDDPSIRRASIAALNSIGHVDMEKRVMQLMTDKDPQLRESALKIAGYFGYPSCRTFVHKLCSDENMNVRIAAIESLPAYEDDRLLAALKCLYEEENPRIRAAVVRSLGQMESKQAFTVLSQALGDPDPWVRYYAVKSAAIHGFVDLIPAIREMAVKDDVPFARLAAIDFLGQSGGRTAVSILASLTGDENRDVALASIAALGDIHHPDALPPLLALSKTSDAVLKKHSIEAIGRRGGSGAAGALQWVAITEKDQVMKQSAINSLRLIANKEAVTSLLSLTSYPENREKAISALSCIRLELMNIIMEGLNHKNTLVRTAVVEVLLRMRSPQASARLAMCLRHKDPNVRLATINALNRLGNTKYMKKLLELRTTDPEPAIRKAVEDIINVKTGI